jgi:hypothetical protein
MFAHYVQFTERYQIHWIPRVMLRILLFYALLSVQLVSSDAVAKEIKIKTLALKPAFKTMGDWHVTASQFYDFTTTELGGNIPTKICFWVPDSPQSRDCSSSFVRRNGHNVIYAVNRVDDLDIVTQPPLVRAVSRFSGGGSGTLTEIAFWRYDSNHDQFKKAGTILLTEQGEYRLEKNLLLTADYLWGDDETHFSFHRFKINAYRYAPDTGFKKILTYTTENTYPSLDRVDQMDVLSHELPHLHQRLPNE